MKKFVRIMVLFTFVVLAVVFTACSKEEGEPDKSTEAPPTITPYPTHEPYEFQEGNAKEFSVSGVFSDNMVIQRDQEIVIYGTAPESENGNIVNAFLKDLKGSGVIENGKWKVVMQGTLPASKELGHALKVVGEPGTDVIFEDVLIGDVWYINGQSNADLVFFPEAQKHYTEELKKVSRDMPLRYFTQMNWDLVGSPQLLEEPQENPLKRYKWKKADRTVVTSSPMMGYFFAAKMLELNPDVPIGIVNVACGGASLAHLAPKEVVDKFPAGMKNKQLPINTLVVKDSGIYNAFMHPFIDFGIKGMLFYQGESDTVSYKEYPEALNTYVQDLRDRFGEHFYFLNVQLSSYGYYAGNIPLTGIWDQINDLRNAQAKVRIDDIMYNYEIVPSLDCGWQEGDSDGAHPIYKKPICDRLANIAAALVYGIGDMENAACPVPKDVRFESDKVVIEFMYAGGGLKVNGDKLNGFEVLINGKWDKIDAGIEGNKVIINGDNIEGVRYGYDLRIEDPSQITLVSGTDNPAVAFEVLK
jgi:sialate O-acetylesterase